MAFQVHRQPLIGHGLIVAMLLGSIGAARIAYVDPKLRELSVLQADQVRISTQLTDLQKGIQEMESNTVTTVKMVLPRARDKATRRGSASLAIEPRLDA